MSGPGPRLAGIANADIGRVGRVLYSSTGNSQQAPGLNSNQMRTFALMDSLRAAFSAFRNPYGYTLADTDPTTLDTGFSADAKIQDWQEYFKVDNSRLQVYEDAKEMDESTDEVAAALDTLSDSAVNPEDGSADSFVLEIEEGQYRDYAESLFSQVTEALDLQTMAYSITRNSLKFGDCFFEVVVDEQYNLVRGKVLPAETVWRNEDTAGNLLNGTPAYDADGKCINEPGSCAFDQRESLHGKMLAAFDAWQIVHFRWSRNGNDRYGRSMLRTARIVWKKLKAVEEAVVIARLQRAWLRYLHKVDTTGMHPDQARAALMNYRQELNKRYLLDTQMRENPLEVVSDYYITTGYIRDLDGAKFLPRQSGVEVLQGDHAALGVMADIEYFQNKLFASLRVPKAYLGFERDINARATLSTQDIQYARTLRRIQGMLSRGYKEIFDLALILSGINPSLVKYKVRWPAILVSDEERDAIIRRYHAQADSMYWQMGAPSTKWIIQERFGFDDEAWESDLISAQDDPPARFGQGKVQPNGPMQGVGTGQQTVAGAAAGAQTGTIQFVPEDNTDAGGALGAAYQTTEPAATHQRIGAAQSPFGMVPSANAGTEDVAEGVVDYSRYANLPGFGGYADGQDPFDADDDDATDLRSSDLTVRRAAMRRQANRPIAPHRMPYQSWMSVTGVHSAHPTQRPVQRTSARRVARSASAELQALYAQMAQQRQSAAERVHG